MQASKAGFVTCHDCHQINQLGSDGRTACCLRCGAHIHARRPKSLSTTWALLLSAAILYLPANLLPIMTVNSFGKGQPATIFEGVLQLISHGMLPIAAVVFVASILVPSFKLIGIALLLISLQFHVPMSAQQRLVMYRFIEWIGRWSMLDIFVIAILVALVNFGNLANIEADAGAVAFACVVILTMLAALTFDPRLIWDNTGREHD